MIRADRIEGIFTIPWSTDFSIAALLLHRATGIPLYVFEMDDWEARNRFNLCSYLNRKYHGDLLRAAQEVWLISPAMVETYRDRFGVSGRFLCQAVDVESYQRASKGSPAPGARGEVKLVYTGSINGIFRPTLKFVCDMVNAGMEIDGRRVRIEMFTQTHQEDLAGPWVTLKGYVPIDDVPRILADADVLLLGVSFEKAIEPVVRTSLFTKTIDYLASGRPMLMVAPGYSAVARYCRDGAEVKDTALVVDRLDRGAIEAGLRRIVCDREDTAKRSARGVDFVRRRHDVASIEPNFLRYFRDPT